MCTQLRRKKTYWSKEGAGRTRITKDRRKLQTYAKTYVVETVHDVEARNPFWGNRGAGRAPITTVRRVALAGATLASQGRSHEVQDLLRYGQRSANHDGKDEFSQTALKSRVLKKYTPSRREAHFGEGAGRAPITTHRRKLQTMSKTHVFENVRAVEARRSFWPIWRFRAVLAQTPGVQSK